MAAEAIESTAIYNKLVKGKSPLSHYYVDDSGRTVYYYRPKPKDDKDPEPETREVMDYWVVFKEKRHNVRTNTHIYRLIGKDIFGNKLDISLPYDIIYGSNSKLFAEIAQHFNIKCNHDLKRSDNLQNIIAELTPEGTTIDIKEFDRIMWDNDKLIIPNMEPEGYICNIDKKRFPYDMPEELDTQTGLEALKYIIDSVGVYNAIPIIILILISPVIGKMFPDDRYGLAVIGETDSLKTAISRKLLRIYGNGFESKSTMIKMGDSGSTKVGIGIFAAIAGCMPVLLDNFKPYTHWSNADLAALIHNLMEGSDKTRGTKDEGLKDVKEFYTLPILTGEDYAVDAATSARIMKVDWVKPDITTLDKATAEMRGHLPAIGRAWIMWLATDEGIAAMEQMKREFPKKRGEVRKEFDGVKANNPDRLSSNLAIERLGMDLILKHPILGVFFKKYDKEYESGFSQRVIDVGQSTSEGSEVNQIVDMLRDGIATGTLTLGEDNRYGITKIGECSQTVDKDTKEITNYIYIYPDVLTEYISKHLISSQKLSEPTLTKLLVSHKLIIPDANGKSKQLKWISSTRTSKRVYVFKKETLIDESAEPEALKELRELRAESIAKATA